MDVPRPLLKARTIDPMVLQKALALGIPAAIAALWASRSTLNPTLLIKPSLAQLTPPWSLKDIDKGADRIAQAIIGQEYIGIETDHDCDGQTSHAVIMLALTEYFKHPANKVRSYIGHRLKEGYGLSEPVVQRILADAPPATVIITADNGSSDEPRIQLLKAQGIDVIVTDHHEVPKEGVPKSAYAVINPNQPGCQYPDRFIAGCMVAWLTMAAVRAKLIERHALPLDAPKLTGLLDYVAVGTVADCVSMAESVNNRLVVQYGLQQLSQTKRPCWKYLQAFHQKTKFSCEDLSFTLGPLLNSDGRLSSAFGSVSFLLAQDLEEAELWHRALSDSNQERKAIQKQLVQEALCSGVTQYYEGKAGLAVFLETGHTGVHGIVASKLKEYFGRPCVMLAPKAEGLIAGSARGVPGIHVRQALEWVHEQLPGAIIAFGGHTGAAGLTLHREALNDFKEAWHHAILRQQPQIGHPIHWHDGPLPEIFTHYLGVKTLWELGGPFGREYEAPSYLVEGVVRHVRPIGKDGQHARITLQWQGKEIILTHFHGGVYPALSPMVGQPLLALVTPKLNDFQGQARLDFLASFAVHSHHSAKTVQLESYGA